MKDINTIENLILEKGKIVTHQDLVEALADYKDVNGKILDLANKGFLVNLRRGIYFIAKLGSLGYTSISNYLIANAIGEESFVSFEAALKYHGLYDQGLKKIQSISKEQYLNKTVESIVYEYVKVKDLSYFGFEKYKVDGGTAKIATKERAILDIIEYKRTVSNISIVQEKLNNLTGEFDWERLACYAERYSQTTIKTLGLVLDFMGKDMDKLNLLINKKSTSRISTNSSKFSNKWRLYYDSALEEYAHN
jgi:predicted transcriptional regulator of viral defense system